MNIASAGTMISLMVLCVFGGVISLGGVTPQLLSPSVLLAVLLALLWGIKCVAARDVSWSRSPMHWPAAILLAYVIARYFTSALEHEARTELFQVGVCALIYFVCAVEFHGANHRRVFLVALMVVALLESGYGVWQALTKSDAVLVWAKPEGYIGRASGTLICPNNLAGFLELGLGLVIARAAVVRRESQSIERAVILKILIIYVAVMMISGIVLTLSRAGWAATLAGLTAFLFLGDWRPRFSYPRIAIALAVVGSMSVALWKLESVRQYALGSISADAESQGLALKDTSMGGRTLMWAGTVQLIREHPIFGSGGGSWEWVYQAHKHHTIQTRPEFAHNDFLNLASDYGIVGFLLVAAVFVGFVRHQLALRKAVLAEESRAFAMGAMVSVCAILVHSWFDFNLHIPGNSFLLAAILGLTAGIEGPGTPRPRMLLNPLQRKGLGVLILVLCGLGAWRFGLTVAAARYTELGNEMKGELSYDEALAYYRKAIAIDPLSPMPLTKTGDIYLNQASWRRGPARAADRHQLAKNAIKAFDRSLQLNPYQVDVLINKARSHGIIGESSLALQSYEKAIATCPVQAHSYFLLGIFHRDQGDVKRAEEAFRKSDQLTPSDAARLNSSDLISPEP